MIQLVNYLPNKDSHVITSKTIPSNPSADNFESSKNDDASPYSQISDPSDSRNLSADIPLGPDPLLYSLLSDALDYYSDTSPYPSHPSANDLVGSSNSSNPSASPPHCVTQTSVFGGFYQPYIF